MQQYQVAHPAAIHFLDRSQSGRRRIHRWQWTLAVKRMLSKEMELCRNGVMEASTSGRNVGVSIELRNVEFG